MPSRSKDLFAIVDIETTGGFASGSGITEIAIIVHDGRQIIETWESLVNPQQNIPYFITQLTGISQEMVAEAPLFSEVAAQVFSKLDGKVFVAHNVNFDYSFVKHQLAASGYQLDVPKLCTVRFARKVVPGYPKYSLGNICQYLAIPHQDRHRAMGDAHATALLFALLLARDEKDHLSTMLKGRNKEQYLPANLPATEVERLPQMPGVYYFKDALGKVIYVGKAVNLLKRVKSHFANNKSGAQKQDFLREIHHLSFTQTATDLMAQILESVEIRKLWPKYNRSQRGFHPKFGVYAYEDQKGYLRLAVEAHKPHMKAIHSCNALHEATAWLRQLATEFGLCTRLCHLAAGANCERGLFAEGCSGQCCEDAELYNQRVREALQWTRKALPTLALIDIGRTELEQSCILIEEGVYQGMGYFSKEQQMNSVEDCRGCIEPFPDNDFIRSLIYRYAGDFPEKCLKWEVAGGVNAAQPVGVAGF